MSTHTHQNPILRLTELTHYDLDYAEMDSEFQYLIEIAKFTTGLKVGLINLIDTHHLWPISQRGTQIEVMPLKDTPCQFTIQKDEYFEVKDLTKHKLLKEMDYVKAAPYFKYYFGVPLKTAQGINIGSLCLFETQTQELNETQIKILGIIAREAVAKIEVLKAQNNLRREFFEYRAAQRTIANDLRNPLAGIIGLSDLLIEQYEELQKEEAIDYNELINKSSKSILSVLDDVIINQKRQEIEVNTLNLDTLKQGLIALYSPLILVNKVKLNINVNELKANILFLKSHVNYLIGNLLVEAILNIAAEAGLTLALDLIIKVDRLYIKAEFTSENRINSQDLAQSEVLNVYKNKVEELGGELIFSPNPNQLYELTLPLKSI